jgi:hypothetical protein
LRVLGDADRQFELTLENVAIALRNDRADQEVLNLTRFGALRLRNVALQNNGAKPTLVARNGNEVELANLNSPSTLADPLRLDEIREIHRHPAP